MIAVLDTSAAVAAALGRDGAEAVLGAVSEAELVLAPTLFAAEAANAFWKYFCFGSMPLDACEAALAQCVALPDDYVSDADLHREAFGLACLAKKTVYDMLYLVLARRNDAVLLTIDKDLRKTARSHSIRVA